MGRARVAQRSWSLRDAGRRGKEGPNLSKAGEKLDPGEIERRIIDPTAVQLDAEMPALGDKIPAEDIRAIAQWLGKRK